MVEWKIVEQTGNRGVNLADVKTWGMYPPISGVPRKRLGVEKTKATCPVGRNECRVERKKVIGRVRGRTRSPTRLRSVYSPSPNKSSKRPYINILRGKAVVYLWPEMILWLVVVLISDGLFCRTKPRSLLQRISWLGSYLRSSQLAANYPASPHHLSSAAR